jgi:hypothetical protein
LGPVNIEHNNGDDGGDDGQADDHDIYHDHDDQDDDCDYMTINLNLGYGNNFELGHMQDVDMSKGVDRGGDYDNDDIIDDYGDGHIDLEGPLGSYKNISGKLVRYKLQKSQVNWELLLKLMISQD